MSRPVVLITGASSGIGFCCAEELLDFNSTVIMASRTPPPGDKITQNPVYVPLDLISRSAVKSFVDEWSYGAIDSLILNAGAIKSGKPTFDANGIETTFAVNYLNQAYLFFLLRNKGLLKPRCRLILLTTALHDPNNPVKMPPHWTTPESVAKASDVKLNDQMTRYSTSKLANLFFAYALHRRLLEERSELEVITYEPGYVPGRGSRLARDQGIMVNWLSYYLGPLLEFIVRRMGVVVSTPRLSGRLMAELALKRDRFASLDVDGKYVLLDRVKESSVESYDEDKQEALWAWTMRELGLQGNE